MKRNLLLTIAFSCTAILANAQMRVSSNGNMAEEALKAAELNNATLMESRLLLDLQ